MLVDPFSCLPPSTHTYKHTHAYWQSRRYLYIITDYVENGELLSLWLRIRRFPEIIVKIYIAQVAMVLDYLHEARGIRRRHQQVFLGSNARAWRREAVSRMRLKGGRQADEKQRDKQATHR